MQSASGAVSAGSRVLMDDPGNGAPLERDPLERLIALLGPRLDEARALIDELGGRWRGDAVRVGEGTRRRLHEAAREIGLVTREDWDELDLRIAQIEHRLRLLESRETDQP